MTCFWKGILDCLVINDFERFNLHKKPTELGLVQCLKAQNKVCMDIICTNENITKQFAEECYEAVKCFDETSINSGYLCSTCDPFLILVSELFEINIYHRYNCSDIRYINGKAKKTIYVTSNRGHFQKV